MFFIDILRAMVFVSDCIIPTECGCLAAESLRNFLVGVSNVKPRDQQRMDIDEWKLGICKKHDDEIAASANETLVCDEAVSGRYLVIQFYQKTEYLLLCEVTVQTCKYRGNKIFLVELPMCQLDERIHHYVKCIKFSCESEHFELPHHQKYNIDSGAHYVVWF